MSDKKYGIWNSVTKEFQFGIIENTRRKAESKLFKKIDDDARKYRFITRVISDNEITKMKNKHIRRKENINKFYKDSRPYKIKKKKRIRIQEKRQKAIGDEYKRRGLKCHFKITDKKIIDEKIIFTIGTLESEMLFEIEFQKHECDLPDYNDEMPKELSMKSPENYDSWRMNE